MASVPQVPVAMWRGGASHQLRPLTSTITKFPQASPGLQALLAAGAVDHLTWGLWEVGVDTH